MNNTTDFFEEVNISTLENAFNWISNKQINPINDDSNLSDEEKYLSKQEQKLPEEKKKALIESIKKTLIEQIKEESEDELEFYFNDIDLFITYKSNKEIEEDKKDFVDTIEVVSYKEDLATFLKEFCLLKRGNQTEVCRIQNNGMIDFHDLKAFHEFHRKHNYQIKDDEGKEKKQYISRIWQEHKDVRQFTNIVFDPSFTAPKSHLNLFKPWKTRAIQGDVSMFIELIEALTNYHKESTDYLLNYLAHAIQNPALLPLVAVVIRSMAKGVGKGTLSKVLHRITDNFKHFTKREELIGQFTGHLADAFIVIADELTWAGNKQDNDVMKGIITEETVTINGKFKDIIEVKNYKRLFIFSNNSFCAPVEIGDRRFFVCDASDKLKHTEGWFKKFNEWLNKNGADYIFHYLLNRDISKFNPEVFPTTKARIDLMKRNLTPVQKFIYELFNGSMIVSNTTYEERIDATHWIRSMVAKDCQEWLKTSGTSYYDNTLKDDISKTLNSIFEFEKIKDKWATNWKDSKGNYFYKLPKTTAECQKIVAEKLFQTEHPEWVYENYEAK